jgi:hypothetical protein
MRLNNHQQPSMKEARSSYAFVRRHARSTSGVAVADGCPTLNENIVVCTKNVGTEASLGVAQGAAVIQPAVSPRNNRNPARTSLTLSLSH